MEEKRVLLSLNEIDFISKALDFYVELYVDADCDIGAVLAEKLKEALKEEEVSL